MSIVRRIILLIIGALGALLTTHALADWPEKPIRFVVPFVAGGGADLVSRAVAEGMSKVLGRTVVVDNKPGGDATIGGALVAKAPPDGYTIMFGGATGLYGAPHLRKTVGYDPVRDFTPVSTLCMFPYFVTVSNELPVKNMRELVEYIRANPGKVNYGSANAMGIIANAQIALVEKLQMVHVPYKSEAPALPDLLANRLQMIFATGFIIPHAKDGRVRVIATLDDQRNDALPDVPTLAEAGYPYIAIRAMSSVVAPAGLPSDIQNRLSLAVNESLRMESTKKTFATLGFTPQGSTPKELGELIRAQLVSWGKGVKAAGLTPE